MERLVCGDVGYGKTEVAMRAAFKAVYDNKQVAVLVPTTVLAQQHYDTFQRRFAPYAVHIGLLSRLRGRKEQQQVLAGCARHGGHRHWDASSVTKRCAVQEFRLAGGR